VLAHHRGWRFSGVAVDAAGCVQLHFDSSAAHDYTPAVGRKWAKRYLPEEAQGLPTTRWVPSQ
jgi:hypothetical protein